MAGKDTQTLPSKEAGLFRTVVRCYETKQYKKAVKTAEQVLRKFPQHGETLSMKGLIFYNTERTAEGYDLARQGLRNNVRSHVCWHVYGLLHRSDRNYDEAIKCYKQALRIDKDNLNILKDLAQLQLQMRDVSGQLESRVQLLNIKSSSKVNWVSLAVAHRMAGNHELAWQVLEKFANIQETPEGIQAGYEHSEMLLYQAQLLLEAGKLQEALHHLATKQDMIVDNLGFAELLGKVLMGQGRHEEAAEVYRKLLHRNPDNQRHHAALLEALQLDTGNAEQLDRVAALYDDLGRQFPRSMAVRRLPLDFKDGQAFEVAAEAYIKAYLDRGAPSLFSTLKPLYRDAAKAEALGRVLERLHSSAQAETSGSAAPSASPSEPSSADSTSAPQPATSTSAAKSAESIGRLPNGKAVDKPEQNGREPIGTTEAPREVWAALYLAQHHDYQGRTGKALELLQQAQQAAPTLIELHSVQARFLKHGGCLRGAAKAAVHAESLDMADRYLNSMAAKYLFRADDIKAGEATAQRFTKDKLTGVSNLNDMQALWYEIESGMAHLRLGNLGMALKRLTAVQKHFADFQEDQFDFHTYCARKSTLRAYMAMLRMQDTLFAHASYSKAAWGVIEAYLRIAQPPGGSANSQGGAAGPGTPEITPEERKRLKQKQRKVCERLAGVQRSGLRNRGSDEEAQKQKKSGSKAEQEEADKAPTHNNKDASQGVKGAAPKDPDPRGEALASTQDPLGEASKLVGTLREYAGDRLQTHLWAFKVYLQRGKLLLALQAVRKGIALAGQSHPQVHHMAVQLCQRAQSQQQETAEASSPVVQQLLQEQVGELLGQKPLDQFCRQYCKQHAGTSVRHATAAAQGLVLLDPSAASEAAGLITSFDVSVGKQRHSDLVGAHKALQGFSKQEQAAQRWGHDCQQLFPQSEYFKDAAGLQNGN